MKEQFTTVSKTRWKLLIYPKFQLSIIALNTFVILGICIAIYAGIKLGYQELHSQGEASNLPSNHPYFNFIAYQSSLIMTYLGLCLFIGVVISNLFILVISHKVAGPIVRLKKHLMDVSSSGEISPIHFRKGDFFSDLPAVVNEAMMKINDKKDKNK
jgi:hypothetical protein